MSDLLILFFLFYYLVGLIFHWYKYDKIMNPIKSTMRGIIWPYIEGKRWYEEYKNEAVPPRKN